MVALMQGGYPKCISHSHNIKPCIWGLITISDFLYLLQRILVVLIRAYLQLLFSLHKVDREMVPLQGHLCLAAIFLLIKAYSRSQRRGQAILQFQYDCKWSFICKYKIPIYPELYIIGSMKAATRPWWKLSQLCKTTVPVRINLSCLVCLAKISYEESFLSLLL